MTETVWSKENCPACVEAKKLLINKGYEIDERTVGFNTTKEDLINAVPNARTVPQIFIEEQYIGGLDNLKKHFETITVKNSVDLQWNVVGVSSFHN